MREFKVQQFKIYHKLKWLSLRNLHRNNGGEASVRVPHQKQLAHKTIKEKSDRLTTGSCPLNTSPKMNRDTLIRMSTLESSSYKSDINNDA